MARAVRRRVRSWLCVFGAAVIVLIGVGHVVLNVHHPSDVMAVGAGLRVLVLCVLLAPPYRGTGHGSGQKHRQRP